MRVWILYTPYTCVHATIRHLIDPLLDFRNPSNVANDNEHNSGTHNGKYGYNEPSLVNSEELETGSGLH